ncbi:MAG: hypothetical protein MR835_00710 [Erysipelotrichaceae bacterium]|nr:hypothetical protein [Erysipelotrichaceae bacterium]
MKNKINVDIIVPSINETYNLFIPINKTVGEIIKLLNQSINELTNNDFPISNKLSLVNLNTGEIYNTSKIVKENHIEDGSRLVLI